MTSSPISRGAVTGVILAGGRGLRFGGADKGLAEYRGRTLVEHQLALLAPQVSAVLISANRNLERYRAFGVPVVSDLESNWAGPLAGMLAGARTATTPWLVCIPCDTLGLPTDTVERLLRTAQAAGAGAAYAAGAEGPQYVVCALRADLADALQSALDAGRHAVRAFLFAQNAVAADFRDCALTNANRPEALACT